MQQNYAQVAGVMETIPAVSLVEDALQINAAGLTRHQVRVEREFLDTPVVSVEKHKVLQILVNLISNAKYALSEGAADPRLLRIQIRLQPEGKFQIRVTDNGMGILAENLDRIFAHGFTTRAKGHGFGLHSGALAAREMGGSLTVQSDGPGRGATFILELPDSPPGPA